MELVYFWVNKYKNIENKGFNFSPRFECEYDEKSEKLTIEKKEGYVSIFPGNINITAIVGKNGSGKSSICGQFYSVIKGKEEKEKNKIIKKIKEEYNDKIKSAKLEDKIKEETKETFNNEIKDKIEKMKEKFLFLIFDQGNYYSVSNLKFDNNDVTNYSSFQDLEYEEEMVVIVGMGEFSAGTAYNSGDFPNSEYAILPLKKQILINSIGDYVKKNILEKIKFSYSEISIEQGKKSKNVSLGNDSSDKVPLGNLSFGEKYRLILFTQLLERVKEEKKSIVFLDEITLSMHPNWEKMFINDLFTFYSKYNVHFIISSHSPFILSDIPKSNVMFLGRDERGNCKNANETIDMEQTFGQNIHTLLSHSFFMKNGLMGEFARKKIDEIKNFYELIDRLKKRGNFQKKNLWKHSYERRRKRFENIQKIIGEPFLKQIMKNYLDELDILFNGKKEFLMKKRDEFNELLKEYDD